MSFNVDLNTLRSIVTVVSFFAFISIVLWAWAGCNQAGFEEAAHLPFEQDSP